MRQVPAMVDQDFSLSESHAILRYLHETRHCEDHWYPSDLKKRAKVDQYLDWEHTHLRYGCAGIVFKTFFGPVFFKVQFSDNEIEEANKAFKKSMKLMNTWLS